MSYKQTQRKARQLNDLKTAALQIMRSVDRSEPTPEETYTSEMRVRARQYQKVEPFKAAGDVLIEVAMEIDLLEDYGVLRQDPRITDRLLKAANNVKILGPDFPEAQRAYREMRIDTVMSQVEDLFADQFIQYRNPPSFEVVLEMAEAFHELADPEISDDALAVVRSLGYMALDRPEPHDGAAIEVAERAVEFSRSAFHGLSGQSEKLFDFMAEHSTSFEDAFRWDTKTELRLAAVQQLISAAPEQPAFAASVERFAAHCAEQALASEQAMEQVPLEPDVHLDASNTKAHEITVDRNPTFEELEGLMRQEQDVAVAPATVSTVTRGPLASALSQRIESTDYSSESPFAMHRIGTRPVADTYSSGGPAR